MNPRPAERARRIGFALALVALVVSVSLVVLEGGLRAYTAYKDGQSVAALPPVEERVIVPSKDAELLYEFRTNIDREDLRTNSFGMRNAEVPLKKPQGVFRIAFVGDSVTASWGYLPREEIYLNVLTNALNADGGSSTHFESLNFGVNGYSIEQGLRVAQTKAPEFEPDLLVAQLSLNDPYPSDSGYGHFAPRGSRLGTFVLRLLDPDRHASWYGIERYYDENGWANVRRAMEGYARLRAQGHDLLLVLFPYLSRKAYEEWDFSALHERYAAEAHRAGVPFFDLYAEFERTGLIEDRLDLHPMSAGHEVAGRAIAAELARRGWL